MSFLDIIIGILLIWGLYKGLKNGLFVELASLVAIIAGIYGAIHFSYITGDYLAERFDWSDQYLKIAAFLITFFAIIIVVNLAGKFLTKIADFAMLGLLNKIAGGIFGALKVAVILGAFLIFFEKLSSPLGLINEESKQESVFYEPIKEIGALVFAYVFDDEETLPKEEVEAREEIICTVRFFRCIDNLPIPRHHHYFSILYFNVIIYPDVEILWKRAGSPLV